MYQQAKDLIKFYEGLVLVSKPCPAGYPTIGWGHRVDTNGMKTTQAEAENLLERDVQKFAQLIKNQVPNWKNLNDDQMNALISFMFNTGTLGNTLKSLLVANIDNLSIEAEINKWIYFTDPKTKAKVKSKGLINRREKEASLYKTGILKKKR